METIYDSYSPVGVIRSYQANDDRRILFALPSTLTAIDGEALQIISSSQNILSVNRRLTRAAKSDALTALNLFFMLEDAAMLCVCEGRITSDEYDAGGLRGFATLSVLRFYAGHPDLLQNTTELIFDYVATGQSGNTSGPFEIGGRYLIMAISVFGEVDGRLRNNHVYLWGEESELDPLRQANSTYFEKILPNAIQRLPEDATPEDVMRLLDSLGLRYLADQGDLLLHSFTAHTTSDMRLILPVSQGRMYLSDGRFLTPGDRGARVCVISSLLAEKNNIRIGDTIDIALADDCYTIEGYQYGRAALGAEMNLPYNDASSYKVVGTYAYTDYSAYGQPHLYSHNDLFIPEGLVSPREGEPVYPYSLSFRIAPDRLDDFYRNEKLMLESLGYQVQPLESAWNNVRGIYEEMSLRQMTLLSGACFFFVCGSILYILLLVRLNRREYALRKLLGAPESEAKRALTGPFYLSSLPAAFSGIVTMMILYEIYMRPQRAQLLMARDAHPLMTFLPVVMMFALIQVLFCRLILHVLHKRLAGQQIRLLLFSS